ncbi:hypothetical protein DFH08DRAFT_1043725 [Mycena albidolilacea]|uniref:Uncharacterized protein n=1 Tax=Mycena albidolilacea TaxID=1033008 RepID=A0AAD7AHA4_9AGAR|nr:hypothetical protein DFH08DRAFT_1043725 [Mycena albidolilacea]
MIGIALILQAKSVWTSWKIAPSSAFKLARTKAHPLHQLALKTLRPGAFGGMLTFRVEGGFEKVKNFTLLIRRFYPLVRFGRGFEDACRYTLRYRAAAANPARKAAQWGYRGHNPCLFLLPLNRLGANSFFLIGIESAVDIIADLEGAFKVAC